MDAARQMTLAALDAGERPSVISAILKYHLTEKLRIVINHAMDIQGGSGICLGPRNLFGRAYQTLPLAITVEGANIMTRCLIIFGQGAMRSHPTILGELEALRAGDRDAFDQVFKRHISNLFGHIARSFWLGLSTGGSRPSAQRPLTAHYRRLSHLSAGFALIADVTLALLGGDLKRKERISARLGDALSQLYLASATIKRFHDEGQPQADVPLCNGALLHAEADAQNALIEVLRNYPNRLLAMAMALRLLIFPLGPRYHRPSDRADSEIATLLLGPGGPRERLTKLVFMGDDKQQTVRLERALNLAVQSEEIEDKIRQANGRKAMTLSEMKVLADESLEQGVINAQQAETLLVAAQARNDLIQVDAFINLHDDKVEPFKQRGSKV